MKKTRILFYGDGPQVATGFGTVSRNILMPLYKTGKYDITVLGINYWGEPHEFPIPTWPVGFNNEKDPYGRKNVQQQIANSEFDILFMIQDSFILDFIGEFIPKLKFNNKKFKSIVYFPIDGVPKREWISAMAAADYPVTYTDYGYKQCVEVFPDIKDRLRIVPHGINPKDFHPLSYAEVADFRQKYFGPLSDKFIITTVNRNQQRKDIPRTIMAFKEFHDKYPDSLLYLHMAARDQGWNLDKTIDSFGLSINKDVIFPNNFGPNKGFPIPVLNRIYNASDVIVSSTTGEGWGLAQVEAMAAKTPIISPDNTACSEIAGEGRGILIRSGHDKEHFVVLPHDNEVIRPIICVQDMVDAFEKMYKDEVARLRYGKTGYDWVTKNLIWDEHIVPQWEAIVDEAVESLMADQGDEYSFSGAVEV